ncbi:hypothetical protein KFK09_023869 [Dendrobium nobile]|uniref:Uncharacterized protein n=1 Tax=Dendrobium nobile TaxID=94219 RepID=A0A8T3ACF3_DENNO|nr:hypothetical protein KFK09_023869 [Dendrobium nobile]
MAPISPKESSKQMMNALTSSYNDQIRPLLDAVDRLRHLKVMQEGIGLPTILLFFNLANYYISHLNFKLPHKFHQLNNVVHTLLVYFLSLFTPLLVAAMVVL